MSLVSREIKQAKKLTDLQAVLKRIPLDHIKAFACKEYNKMSEKQQRIIQLKMLNPNKVLPEDLIQNILSFEYCSQTKPVCKLWEKVCCKIEDNRSKLRRARIKKESPKFDAERMRLMPAVARIFVVDHSRSTLSEEEQHEGYLGPYANPQELLSKVNSKDGDRMLIHSGTYIMDPLLIYKQIQLIGIGPSVVLKYSQNVILDENGDSAHLYFLSPCDSVYFENIEIYCGLSDHFWGCVEFTDGGTLWMKDCSISTCNRAVKVGWGGFRALNCRFSGGVELEQPSNKKLALIGCEFIIDSVGRRLSFCWRLGFPAMLFPSKRKAK